MKKFIFFSLVIFFCPKLVAQVGIGNTDPKSTLDISATNVATPTNTDGILIPRMDDFPLTNPTLDQDGMMVFATGNGTPSKGFYYWDNGSTSWVAVSSSGGSDDDWYEENTTSPPTSNSADIFTDGNVGIGLNNVLYPLQIESPTSSRTVSLLNENTGTSVTGIYNNINESAAAASGSANGIVNSITRSNQSSISGVSNSFQNSTVNAGFAYLYGYQNSFGNSTSNTTFALVNRFQGTTGTAYGTSNLIGGPITNFYGVDNHNISGANLSGNFYGLYNLLTGSDSGNRYGVYTSFAETGSGNKYGEYITIATSAGGTHYGVYSDVRNASGYAGYFLGRTSLGNGTTNRYLMPAADGTAGQVMTTDGAGNISFTTPSSGGVTLDQAYDFGGAGAGRTINAENGAVTINRNSSGAGSALDISLNSSYTLSERSAISTSNAYPGGLETYTNINRTSGPPAGQGLLIKNNAASNINGRDGVAIEFTQASTSNFGNDNRGFVYDVTYNGGGAATLYGYKAEIEGSGGATKYGAHITIPSSSGGPHYGVYSDVRDTGGYAGYFLGRTSLGTGTTNRYLMPSTDGTAGQVMTTNGAGNVTFVTPSTGAEKIDDLTDGKSDNDGTNDGSSVFLGINAGAADDSSDNKNVGIGWNAMQNTVTGIENIAIGNRALQTNTSGGGNIAIGHQSLLNTTNADSNVAVGGYSLRDNTTGDQNTAVGSGALIDNETGNANVALGYQANYEMISNNSNTGIGYQALMRTQGNSNTALGREAGEYADGNNNVLLGERAGSAVTTISRTGSIMIGYEAGYGNTGNNKLYIENSAANADNALIYGEFDNDILRTNGEFQIGNPTATGYAFPTVDGTSGQVMTTDGSGQVSFTTLSLTDTQNTLDEAYDEGGAGAGRIITADNGAVSIEGNSGFQVTGTYNTGAPLALSGAGTRLFFNPRTSAFRAGTVDGSQWDLGNVGNFSMALGYNTVASAVGSIAIGNESSATANSAVALGPSNTASGGNSTAFGSANTASGANSSAFGFVNESSGYGSVAFGYRNTSHSSFETVLGTYATNYTPIESTSNVTDPSDRALVVGNGTSNAARSNALTLYKDGSLNINDAYTFPNSDGSSGQVLTTDGAGVTSWQDNPANFALAKMRLSAVQTSPISSLSKMNFDTAVFDLNGNFNTTTDRFEVTEDGYYRIDASFTQSANNTTNGLFIIAIYVNGTPVKYDRRSHPGAGSITRVASTIESLSAGDYIEVYFFGNSAITVGTTTDYTSFEVERIR